MVWKYCVLCRRNINAKKPFQKYSLALVLVAVIIAGGVNLYSEASLGSPLWTAGTVSSIAIFIGAMVTNIGKLYCPICKSNDLQPVNPDVFHPGAELEKESQNLFAAKNFEEELAPVKGVENYCFECGTVIPKGWKLCEKCKIKKEINTRKL